MGEFFNGRVDMTMDVTNLTSYKLFTENKSIGDFEKSAIKNIHSENELSSMFFSSQNIEILHEGIRYSVYKKSDNKYVIGKQSEHDLMIIMRSIYLQYSQNLPYNIIQQTRNLNSKVLDYTVPSVLRELEQFINYKHDISSLPVPLQHATNMSSKGTKILYSREY
jgi:hypothetical protein